jgi:hypothetical protein
MAVSIMTGASCFFVPLEALGAEGSLEIRWDGYAITARQW